MASKEKRRTSSTRPGADPSRSLGPGERQEIRRAESLEMAVSVVLAEREMTLEEVLQLGKGSVVPFDKRHDAPLEFHVNDRKIGTGRAVKSGEKLGLHILEFASAAETLKKLS